MEQVIIDGKVIGFQFDGVWFIMPRKLGPSYGKMWDEVYAYCSKHKIPIRSYSLIEEEL